MRSGLPFPWRFAFGVTIAAWLAAGAFAAEQPSEIPAWLKSHVGESEGQIAAVVLQRARALYLRKVAAGVVKNPCYFAIDATRPSEGGLGKRFYEISLIPENAGLPGCLGAQNACAMIFPT